MRSNLAAAASGRRAAIGAAVFVLPHFIAGLYQGLQIHGLARSLS